MQILKLLLIHGLACWTATATPDGFSIHYRDNIAPEHTRRVLQYMEERSHVLTRTQDDALSALLNIIHTQDRSQVDSTVAAVRAVFSEPEARFIISGRGGAVSSGAVEERAPNEEANPYCQCSSIAEVECALWESCAWHDQNCGENPGCGPLGLLTCDGMCIP